VIGCTLNVVTDVADISANTPEGVAAGADEASQ